MPLTAHLLTPRSERMCTKAMLRWRRGFSLSSSFTPSSSSSSAAAVAEAASPSPPVLRPKSAAAGYAQTLPHLRIGRHTRVIFQGFTGKQATANARESLAWGTNIVGGVTPGRSGEHLGLPVLPSVRRAVEELRPDATGIYVAAHQATAAIEEALEAEVPLIVAVAEHIPLHDMLRIHSMLKTQSKSRLVGPNSPGIISAVGNCRIGFQPLPCFAPGKVGIVAKSGTLSYESIPAVASTTRAGLGQSLCIGVGGDICPGTDLTEALSVLEHDNNTQAIALVGEIGGSSELEAAAWIEDYHKRTATPKPIVALIAGVNAVPGRIMGHAGAFALPGEPNAQTKIRALERAGATIINHPARFGEALKARLSGQSPHPSSPGASSSSSFSSPSGARRGLHLAARHPPRTDALLPRTQRRHLSLDEPKSMNLLRAKGVNCGQYSGQGERRFLAITIDRSTRQPALLAASTVTADGGPGPDAKLYPFDIRRGLDELAIERAAAHIGVGKKASVVESLRKVVHALVGVFCDCEAYLMETHVVERLGEVKVVGAKMALDDAALRSAGRQKDVHALRTPKQEDPAEIEAEKSGIVYLKLAGDGAIGTLVNGAGLAMNTVDALADAGGRAANFLDTGGKATAETVKHSFEIILRDPRVRVVFVNIFGGLTLGDMIARGIILAFQELAPRVPVVVRIRGTNEAEGQRLIADSGLPLFAFDDFDEAAAKAIELSKV